MKTPYAQALIIFFFIDYTLNTLIDAPILLSLVCWYIGCLYYMRPKSITYTTILLLGLSSFLETGYVGFWYLSLLPASLLCLLLRYWLRPTPLVPLVTFCVALTLHNLMLHTVSGRLCPFSTYTIWQYCVNLIVLLILSLKIQGPAD